MSLFKNSKIINVNTISDTPSGDAEMVVPSNMGEVFNGTDEEVKRVTEAFLKMKKFDLEILEKARKGELH